MMTGGTPLREFAQHWHATPSTPGFAGLVITESGRTAYLSAAVAAVQDLDLDLATGVAVAFPRSPMVTAATAWELAEASGGRFRLGLGTQVRAHIERRYSAPSSTTPGRGCGSTCEAVQGVLRRLPRRAARPPRRVLRPVLLPAMWSPGPIDVPDPPIDIAAVNPWMLRMAGEVADGVHVHPLNTPTYLARDAAAEPRGGARPRGPRPATRRSCPCSPPRATPTTSVQSGARRPACMVGFYGSTPNYAFVFDQIGRPGPPSASAPRQKAGDPAGMAAVIDDEILDHFIVEGPWDEMPDRIVDRFARDRAHLDVQPVLYHAGLTYRTDPDTFGRFGALAAALRNR